VKDKNSCYNSLICSRADFFVKGGETKIKERKNDSRVIMPERPTPPSWVTSLQTGLQREIGINEEQAEAAANAFWTLSDAMGFSPDAIQVKRLRGMVGLEIPPDANSPEVAEAEKIQVVFHSNRAVRAFTPNSFNEVHWAGEKITYSHAEGVTIPGDKVPLFISASRVPGRIAVGIQENMPA